MVELYFLLYRIPKMMIRLARERHQSGLVWSLLAIGAWIGAEISVSIVLRLIYGIGVILLEWPLPISSLLNFFGYLISLAAALVAVTLVRRILYNKNQSPYFPLPPPPPGFENED